MWTVSVWPLIIHLSIPYVIRPFQGYHYFLPCDLDLGFGTIFEDFNLANNIWTVSARALIFHMIFLVRRPLFLTLWPWSLRNHFLKTLTLLITFEQWVLELSYCTWTFFVTRSSFWYYEICPCDHGHLWNTQVPSSDVITRVLFRTWGINGACLRKVLFLSIYWMKIHFISYISVSKYLK